GDHPDQGAGAGWAAGREDAGPALRAGGRRGRRAPQRPGTRAAPGPDRPREVRRTRSGGEVTLRHVAVVGAGPAGLAAAEAALSAGARVTLIESADQPGGQYHRMLPEAYDAARPEALQHGWRAFDRRRRRVLAHQRCAWWSESSVWALERPALERPGVPRV